MATPDSIPRKSPSHLSKGSGLKEKTTFLSTIADRHIVRDNFTFSTWLLLGASLQCLLLTIPIRPSYVVLPALLLLGYRFVNNLLMCFGIIKHPYADDVIPTKMVAMYPESYDINGEKKPNGGVCVIMLFARCNHPLGMFAPQFKQLADRMQSLVHDLDTHAPTNGFLGGNGWLSTDEREAGSDIMTLCYFKTYEDLLAFAHGEHHRKVWDWWNALMREKKVGHISIAHEVYCAPKGAWEGIYINQAPTMFAATSHWATDSNGGGSWKSPLVTGKGRYKSSRGRMGKSNGDDNEAYGEEPYEEI